LNDAASSPVSSVVSSRTCVPRSPSRTRSIAARSSSIWSSIERASSSVTSNEIVEATATDTSTSQPRSARFCESDPDETPETTTAVNTLSAGTVSRSFQRSGTWTPTRSAFGGRSQETSSSTGRMSSSIPKKRSSTP
jgi:hypothetical protein